VVLNEPKEDIRIMAVWEITDQEVLQKVIRRESSDKVLYAAVKKIDPSRSLDFLRTQKNHKNLHVRRTARLNLLVAEPEIKALHGPLTVGYSSTMKSRVYGKNFLARAYSETIWIYIRNRDGHKVLGKKYQGKALKSRESFSITRRTKRYHARVDYKEIRSLLLIKSEGS